MVAPGISTVAPTWAVETELLPWWQSWAGQAAGKKGMAHHLSKWPTDVEMDGTFAGCCRGRTLDGQVSGAGLRNQGQNAFISSANVPIVYRQSPYPWATLTDGGPPFFPAAWPAQLCHQGSNSLLPRQVAHHLSKCLGPPYGIFTRLPWP